MVIIFNTGFDSESIGSLVSKIIAFEQQTLLIERNVAPDCMARQRPC